MTAARWVRGPTKDMWDLYLDGKARAWITRYEFGRGWRLRIIGVPPFPPGYDPYRQYEGSGSPPRNYPPLVDSKAEALAVVLAVLGAETG